MLEASSYMSSNVFSLSASAAECRVIHLLGTFGLGPIRYTAFFDPNLLRRRVDSPVPFSFFDGHKSIHGRIDINYGSY
jgi:hypothetical protein